MNGKMWVHPATVANVEILRQRGANFIGPEKGMLACGYEGIGRLWPVDEIVAKALEYKKRWRTARSLAQNNRRRDQSPPIPAND
jgi:phosphopantothenoylcysteine synthetase/decarboxylase